MLISTKENFLDNHGKATKSDDFSPNLLENKAMEIFLPVVLLVSMTIQFSTPCLVKFFFLVFFSNTNKIFQAISNS